MYRESDPPDANDLYGRSKLLGEVNYQHCITLRTSIIGHETKTAHSLLEWFLSQDGGSVRGFERAVFSGLPTVELARVIHDYVLKHKKMHGLYHVSSKPINKYDLLQLIASEYKINTNIERDDEFLSIGLLTRPPNATGFRAKPWNEMIAIQETLAEFIAELVMFKDKVLMITGGTGSFGNAVLRRFLATDFSEIRIFSRDELKQENMRLSIKTLK